MSESVLEIIQEHNRESSEARLTFFREHSKTLIEAARAVALCMARKGKLLLCGNGGSAADAQHLAAEFVNRFLLDRPPLPAIALTTDTSIITAIGNDYDFELIFSKQVLALGQPGDVLLAISTSGNSTDVLKAIEAARAKNILVIGLTGRDGGAMADLCDILLNVAHPSTPAVQETHIAAGHLLCRLCDYYLFENVQEIMPYI